MTLDGFLLCKVVLSFFVYPVTSRQSELAFQLMMGSNANDKPPLLLGCLPPLRSLLMGNILINLTGLSRWDDSRLRLQNDLLADNYLYLWLT